MADNGVQLQPTVKCSSTVDYAACSPRTGAVEDEARSPSTNHDSFAPPGTSSNSTSATFQQHAGQRVPPSENPVTLSWENIKVFVKEEKKQKRKESVRAEPERGQVSLENGLKQIISNVSGVLEPGSLLAIMGASGAGKSTLMNVLANRNLKDYIVDGKVKINGVSTNGGIRNISAYVQQDDLFFSTLTVRETLTFRALLRMDKGLNREARLAKMEKVIQEMGLSKCADTKVGTPGSKKGISGGESKRLSFACEMLTDPLLFFCDEPTSGLDSFMAQNVVQILENMAKRGRTVLCTIHQPSSEIFAMFDRLLLLAEGRVAFMGESSRAVEYFRSLNHICPINFNPADFYILTLAIVPGNEKRCKAKVQRICDSFVGTQETADMKNRIEELASSPQKVVRQMEEIFRRSRYEASIPQQFTNLMWRTWVSLMRDVILFRVRFAQTLSIALMMGLIYLRLKYDQKGVMNINGAIFALVINLTFSNVFAVINSFPHEMAIFFREYGSGLYRTDVYFLAKCLAELPVFIALPFILISIDYWMIGFYETWQAFLIATGYIILVANVAVSFGQTISTTAANVNIALAVASPIVIPFMMFGGFFLNDDSVPVYFAWLKDLSWFKYANELLLVNQWQDVNAISCLDNSTRIPCQFKDGEDVLLYLSFSADNISLDIGMMLALLVGLKLLAFTALLIRARRSKI